MGPPHVNALTQGGSESRQPGNGAAAREWAGCSIVKTRSLMRRRLRLLLTFDIK